VHDDVLQIDQPKCTERIDVIRYNKSRQRKLSVFIIPIDTCNREPTAPESFACMDLSNTTRCGEFRGTALFASVNLAEYTASESCRTATRSAQLNHRWQEL